MNEAINLLVLPRYGKLGTSSRLRFNQYLPYLRENGFSATEAPLLDDRYMSARQHGGARYDRVLGSYANRVSRLRGSGKYDLIWAEQEFLPWLPASMELRLIAESVPLVLDCDDAIFHRYDGHPWPWVRRMLGRKIDSVMGRANLALAGNGYLATRARDAGCRRVEQVPTVIDLERYPVPKAREPAFIPTVGWLGSPSTATALKLIAPVLARLQSRYAFRCIAVGARADQVEGTPFEAIDGGDDNEVQALRSMDIGVMPQSDAPWDHGRCGYRLLQFMASALPVIVAPAGLNRELVSDGVHGLLATTDMEWESALQALLPDPGLRNRMGFAGRRRVEQKYSLQGQAPRLAEILRSVVARKH